MLDSVIGSHLAMIAGVAMTLLIVPRMLRQRRSAASMTAWLMAILLIPWLGIPAYLVLGGRKLVTTLMLKPQLGSGQPTAALPAGEAGADQLLQSYGLPRAQSGNRFSLCADGVEIYQKFIEVIEGAENRIHMASFILNPDPVGRAIIEALAQRARHGLEVRLLLDGFGSFHTSKRSLDPWSRAGGETAFFLPVQLRHFTRTNMRNHRKRLIADDRKAVAGGANVAAEYRGPAPDPKPRQCACR
jgi:cardiolipin synthase A/B